MNLISRLFGSKKAVQPKKEQPTAYKNGDWGRGYSVSFDGEKNIGEVGPILKYELDYEGLRLRSWQAYIESEIAKTVLNRFSIWIIDKGLKLQCNPSSDLLEMEGIQLDSEKFNKSVESRFSVWSKSKHASFNGMHSLNDLAKKAFKNAKIGGDCLVVLRFKNNRFTVEIIDGAHLSRSVTRASDSGNRIYNGVEIDGSGKHVRYHVKSGSKIEEIPAFSKTGLRMAFLVYGSEYRMDNHRGLPIISTSLESMKKVERYKEATVGSAEERQKIPYFFEHKQFSDGENPLVDGLTKAFDADYDGDEFPIDAAGNQIANDVALTTNKQVFNMPKGATVNAIDSQNELSFPEFYGTNANIICSAIGIPPNVAFSLYNDSFSASRAATKDWEHTIDFERDDFQCQFYNHIFAFWLHIEILNNKIQAPGYLKAFSDNDIMILEAYRTCRFTGPMFPHIDPLKEVKAEREKLGPLGKNIPLTTIEASTEQLFGGDSKSNVEQFSKEIEHAKQTGLELRDEKSIVLENNKKKNS